MTSRQPRTWAIALVALVFLAGCSGFAPSDSAPGDGETPRTTSPVSTTTATTTETETVTTTATEASTTTEIPTTTPPPEPTTTTETMETTPTETTETIETMRWDDTSPSGEVGGAVNISVGTDE